MDVMQNNQIKILVLSLSCIFTIQAKEGYLAKVGSKPLSFDRPVLSIARVLAQLPPLQKVTPDPRTIFPSPSTNSAVLSLAGLNVGKSATNQTLDAGFPNRKSPIDRAQSGENSSDLSSGGSDFDGGLESVPTDLSPQSLMPFFRPANGKGRKKISVGIPDFQPGRPSSEASSSATYERQ